MHPAALKVILALLTLCSLAGCGYTTQTTFREDVTSVAVPIFENRSFHRGLEFVVTEAVVKELAAQTPYRVLDVEQAQTVLEGEIIDVSQARLSRTETGGFPQEVELRVRLNLVWRNRRSGEVLMDRHGLVVVGRYVPPVGELTEVAYLEAARRVAYGVIDAMRSQW